MLRVGSKAIRPSTTQRLSRKLPTGPAPDIPIRDAGAGLGLTAETVHAEDRVVGIRPLRDGRHGGSMVFVIGPHGKSYGANPEALGLRVEDLKP